MAQYINVWLNQNCHHNHGPVQWFDWCEASLGGIFLHQDNTQLSSKYWWIHPCWIQSIKYEGNSWVSGASAFVGSITGSKWPETKGFLLKLVSPFLFWERKANPCEKLPRNWRSHITLCTTPFTEQLKLSLTRIERGEGGPGAQLSKRTSTFECLVWETDASQVLNWQLHEMVPAKHQSLCQQWIDDPGMLAF